METSKSCTRYATTLVEIYQTQQLVVQTSPLNQVDKQNAKELEQIHRVRFIYYRVQY